MSIAKRLYFIVHYGAYIPNEYFVDHRRKFVYIAIPKVACTSIKETLFFSENSASVEYNNYMKIHKELSSNSVHNLSNNEKVFFKFAFVRNPFDRLISCYLDKVIKPKQHNDKYYFDTRYSRLLLKSLSGISLKPSMSFPDFVKCVSRTPDWLADGHFRSQHHFFQSQPIKPDFIGKFESINEDWQILIKKNGFPKLTHRNATRTHNLVDWYYDKKVLDMAYKRYACDVEQWYVDEYKKLKESVA